MKLQVRNSGWRRSKELLVDSGRLAERDGGLCESSFRTCIWWALFRMHRLWHAIVGCNWNIFLVCYNWSVPISLFLCRWFDLFDDPDTQTTYHRFNNRYWEAKLSNCWGRSPDIF